MSQLHRFGHKAYSNILKSLSENSILSTKALAEEQNHSSTSRILKYLESMQDNGLVKEFFETICSIKHDCKFRSTHYLVRSDEIKDAYKTQKKWIKKGSSVVDVVDVRKFITGDLLFYMTCKKCKRIISMHSRGDDDYSWFNESRSQVMRNKGKPVRHWSLTINGIFHIISSSKNLKLIKKLVRKHKDEHEVLKLASLLHIKDLELLVERLRTAKKFRLDLAEEANRWLDGVKMDLSKYDEVTKNKIQNFLSDRHLNQTLLNASGKRFRNETWNNSERLDLNNILSIIDLGEKTIVKSIHNRIVKLKNEFGVQPEKEEIRILENLSKDLPNSWRKSMSYRMGITR